MKRNATILGAVLALVMLFASVASSPASHITDCVEVSINGERVYRSDSCTGSPGATPTSDPGPVPTRTPTATADPGPVPTWTPTPTVDPGPLPTPTDDPPTPTPDPGPIHDVNLCHGAMDGHTHGFCVSALPSGVVKDFLLANPEFAELDHPWPSSECENQYPYVFPHCGKHEGFKNLFMGPLETCHQFANIPGSGEGLCLKSLWLQVHSLQTAEAQRTHGSLHSLLFVAEVCNDVALTSCGVIAGAQPSNYGEVHAQYKAAGCPNVEGGVYFSPPYSVSDDDPNTAQVPYIATHTRSGDQFFSRPARGFWNSQVNAVVVPDIGDVNTLVEVAWSENMFEVTSDDPELCHDSAHDRVWALSTNDGFLNHFVIWSFRVALEDRPYGWSFTNRTGHSAPNCLEAGFDCIPLFKDPALDNRDVFYNIPVRNATFDTPADVPIIDITEPNVFMPGYDVP